MPPLLLPIVLPTELVLRYRAVDRELVGSALVDTPRHLDELAEDIARRGVLTPLTLGFNEEFGVLDGNHRIAVAVRLGPAEVPVALVKEPRSPRPGHAQPMREADFALLNAHLSRRPASHPHLLVSCKLFRNSCAPKVVDGYKQLLDQT
ncbi:hypothetical protein QRX50_11345 [Amycolatopsis carbonis]|uniref:ParB-like N-terminal domain-containing protein n=1 Tax=Amycolatopsis carbonis TaxID=715471 RepID=A0A9Y2MU21_9PSEU|nr:hypothetical protein [Amycolatopsis sp. 2-15]WIX81310.1 hypothetical protein QRX50_11345 [Amycolatopsis sp. 2-15]